MQQTNRRLIIVFGAAMFLSNCAVNQALIMEGQASISEEMFRHEVKTLGADDFGGRKPGQPGGDKTVDYLVRRIEEIGLVPVMGDSFTHEVPLVNLTNSADSKIIISDGENTTTWLPKQQFLAGGRGKFEPINLELTDVVLTGYGVVDSALGWDQYGDIDYTDKLVIIFRADPGFLSDDTTLFNGKASSPHAFFGAKYGAAEAKGAKAALVVYDVEMSDSDVGWKQISSGRGRASLDTGEIKETPEFLTGFMSPQAATDLLALHGLDYKEVLMAATKKEFEPISLGATAKVSIAQVRDSFVSYNILGMIPGTTRPDEYVIYSAHWDHVGIDTSLEGDQIYNGAADNGTGTASLMVLAKSFLALPERPQRSIIFLWDTAEESGLLGSTYYADNPAVPVNKTVVNINIDMLVPMGKTHDIIVIGYGKSNLDAYVEKAAGKLGIRVEPDPWPEENLYFRSDHISFARKGIPALDLNTGMDHVVLGRDSLMASMDRWRQEVYHKTADHYDDSWDVEGIMDYLKITFDVGYTISNQTKWPQWYKDDEFYSVREASLKGE